MRIEFCYEKTLNDCDTAPVGISYATDNMPGEEVRKAGTLLFPKHILNALLMGLRMLTSSYIPKRVLPEGWKQEGFIIKGKL